MNGNVYTSNTTSDNGVINGLCDGMYNDIQGLNSSNITTCNTKTH